MTKTLRQIFVFGNAAFVPLTRGHVAIIDVKDLDLVYGRNWYAHETDWTCYAASRINGKIVRMHRLIMSAPDGLEVDHENGEGLDNRRANLRIATSAQNKCNRTAGSLNTSGYKGVCLYRPNGKWRSYITVNGKQKSLGYYDTKEQAAEAYAIAVSNFHGEFARV